MMRVSATIHWFLSCLYGSELAPKTYNHLKEKEIPSFSCQKPSFFEVS